MRDNLIIEKEALDEWSLAQLEENPDYTPKAFKLVETISEIYVWINSRYESREKKGKKIEITYNDEYHYPEYIDISYPYSDGDGVGGPTIRMSEFISLVPTGAYSPSW